MHVDTFDVFGITIATYVISFFNHEAVIALPGEFIGCYGSKKTGTYNDVIVFFHKKVMAKDKKCLVNIGYLYNFQNIIF